MKVNQKSFAAYYYDGAAGNDLEQIQWQIAI